MAREEHAGLKITVDPVADWLLKSGGRASKHSKIARYRRIMEVW